MRRSKIVNHIIGKLFKYSSDLIQDKREEIDKDLAREIKNIEHDFERRGIENSGLWYSKRIEVNLNAFEKFIRFRVESDLKNFPLAKTKIVYEKIYERATGGLKGEYPFGTRNIINQMKRNKVKQSFLDSTEKSIQAKMSYLESIVKREIRKDKEREKFNKSFEKGNYNLLKKIADELDEINIFFNKRYGGKKRLFTYLEYKFWFEVNKPCVTKDNFKNCIGYLSNLINEIKKDPIKNIIGEIESKGNQEPGSIIYLEELLKEKFPGKDSESIISCFKGILTIRAKLFHKETKEIIEALNVFKLDYPIEDYQFTFNIIINNFANQISKLHNIFSLK